MTFYHDKKFANKHYSSGKWELLIAGIGLVIIPLILSFPMELMIICEFCGCFLIACTIIKFDLGGYGNLTFFDDGISFSKNEFSHYSLNGLSRYRTNFFYYKIITLNSIVITKKHIKLIGNFEKRNRYSQVNYNSKSYLNSKALIKQIKIPRIFEKEDYLIKKLNEFKELN